MHTTKAYVYALIALLWSWALGLSPIGLGIWFALHGNWKWAFLAPILLYIAFGLFMGFWPMLVLASFVYGWWHDGFLSGLLNAGGYIAVLVIVMVPEWFMSLANREAAKADRLATSATEETPPNVRPETAQLQLATSPGEMTAGSATAGPDASQDRVIYSPSWGAAGFGFLYLLNMRAWKDALLALILMLIPVVNIAAWIYFVTNAKRIAWQTRQWKSFQDFLSCQRRWDTWAKWWTVAVVVIAFIWGIVGSATNGPQQQPATGQGQPQSSESALPPEELQKVTGNAGLDNGLGTFSGKLYNGGSWTITRVIIRVVTSRTLQDPPLNHYPPGKVPTGQFVIAQPDKQVLWNREFRVDFDPPLESLTTQSFSFAVTGDEADLHYSWGIDEAFGQPPASR